MACLTDFSMGLQGSEVRILSPRPVNRKSHYEVAFFVLGIKVPDSNRKRFDKKAGLPFWTRVACPAGVSHRMW